MISNILNNKSVWKFLLLVSYSPGSGYTRSEIMKLCKWNNLSLDRTLNKLLFYKIIKKEKRIIKLNFENKDTDIILNLIEEQKKQLNHTSFELFLIINDFLKEIEDKRIEQIYIFGSHAKKTATPNSDIDLAIFSKEKINLIKAEDKIEQEHNTQLQIHYFNTKELNNKINKIIKNVLKDGIKIL